ncbi:MAG: PqqD family protein [Steroidobacteraceae bacterium]
MAVTVADFAAPEAKPTKLANRHPAADCTRSARGQFTRSFAERRLESTMKLAKYTKFREEKFGGVLFETRSERVYSLNPTAAAVVREIAPGVDERQIVERLKTRFRDAGSVMEREALTFLAELRQKGLLED